VAVFGVIPARGGSKGLPGKNLLPLGGRPLIGWTIAAARASGRLTRTWVSTDDEAIAAVARSLGAEVPFLRPAHLATDEAGIVGVLRHAVEELARATGTRPEITVLLQPTTPFRTERHIDETVALVAEGADSAQTVALDTSHPRVRYGLAPGGRLRPLFDDPAAASRRQEGEPVYRPNGGVYAVRTALLLEEGTLYGLDHRGVVMDFESSIDIDDRWDLRVAEAVLAEGALRERAR
jgi:CMP-N,N'-diacetyllegionaminic acid synthase